METLIKKFKRYDRCFWSCWIWWFVGVCGSIVGVIVKNRSLISAGNVLMWTALALMWIFLIVRSRIISKIKKLKN